MADKLRVGVMPYLNSAVFYKWMNPDSFALTEFVPREMALAVERGELDAGPLPVAEWFRLGDALTPVGDYCVATKQQSVSILLFSKMMPGEMEGARIAVTEQTATTVQLMRVLFKEHWWVDPGALVTRDEPHDAILLIGDEALRNRSGIDDYPFVHDLGEVWNEMTGLPFVYAHWVARSDSDPEAVSELERTLGEGLEKSLGEITGITSEGWPSADMAPEEAVSYIDQFIYRMGDREREALELFRTYYDRLPEWRPGSKIS
ncbi:MAG: menaquinone biosynthesis protein [Chloroflexi bacterium]|nr:menaquinone biosynthesis protein [Chloroflexota bacterium]